MNTLTFGEMIGFAKVYSVCLGMLSPATVSKQEKELAVEAMKKMADDRRDWTEEQKILYKMLADFVKEQFTQG